MGVIPNPKMAFIFPISCILALIFPILIKYFPKCVGKGSFPKSQIKSLCAYWVILNSYLSSANFFSKSASLKNSFRNTIRMSNSLDPDQARHFVWPDLGPNCMLR